MVVYQKFHSPALAGSAIVSKWPDVPSVFGRFRGRSRTARPRASPSRQAGPLISHHWAGPAELISSSTIHMRVWTGHGDPESFMAPPGQLLWQTPNRCWWYDIGRPVGLRRARWGSTLMARISPFWSRPEWAAPSARVRAMPAGIMPQHHLRTWRLVVWLVTPPLCRPRYRAGAPAPRRASADLATSWDVATSRASRIVSMTLPRRRGRRSLWAPLPTVANAGFRKTMGMVIPACPTVCLLEPMPRADCCRACGTAKANQPPPTQWRCCRAAAHCR